MKKTILLSAILLISACQSSPKDIKLTASNKQEVIQEVMPKMSQAEMQTLLAFTMRQSMNKVGEQMSEAIANGGTAPAMPAMNGDWEVLPEGKSINEILKDQKEFESATH